VGDAPHVVGDARQSVGVAPQNVGDAPQNVGVAPQTLGDARHNVGVAPHIVGDAPQRVGVAPSLSRGGNFNLNGAFLMLGKSYIRLRKTDLHIIASNIRLRV
jgi:hypothetical protein